MHVIATTDAAQSNRRRGHSVGNDFWITTYIGANRYDAAAAPPPDSDALYPMAYLIEQDPRCVAPTHFHQADQFQVVVAGGGTLGTHALAPVTVHYTGKYSSYGPIVAGDDGLHYLTLRNGWDPGARYVMEAKERALLRSIANRTHREAVTDPRAVSAERQTTACETCLPPSDDGMSALRYVLAPGDELAGPDPAGGNGQFWIVLAGGLDHQAQTLTKMSCVFLSQDEAAFAAVAGEDGAEVLALQFPKVARQ